MSEKNTSVFGIYQTVASAESAANALVTAGFMNSDISVLAPDQGTPRELGTERAVGEQAIAGLKGSEESPNSAGQCAG